MLFLIPRGSYGSAESILSEVEVLTTGSFNFIQDLRSETFGENIVLHYGIDFLYLKAYNLKICLINMATEGQPIPDLVVARVNENPLLAHVRTISKPDSLLGRNTEHCDPYLHSVHLYVAFQEPQYDPKKMNSALTDVVEGLKPHQFKGTAIGAGLQYGGFGHGSLRLATLYLDEQMGVRTETSTWTFRADNPNAKDVMAQAGIEVGQEYRRVAEKPMTRQISTIFFPSVPLALLAATCEEMSNIPRQEDRPYPFRNSLYAYYGALSPEDLAKLNNNSAYVQEMADKALVGYRVPGIPRTGIVGRIARHLGFLHPNYS